MIDVLLSFNLAAILYFFVFPFPLTPAESIVNGLPNRVGAANMHYSYNTPLVLVLLIISHQYIGAANSKKISRKCVISIAC